MQMKISIFGFRQQVFAYVCFPPASPVTLLSSLYFIQDLVAY